ncbi:MAG: serine hydrolase domain-containing protein, partial [Allosphingosinicella sp.]
TLADGEVRLAAIFARSDEILPRTFRITGPDPIGLDAANLAKAARIDERMKSYLLAHNLRGAAIAVVDGTRLVYAKGYTFAEPEPYYMDIEPTTLFRLASISKTFAALAVWKALEAGTHSLSSRMQDILGLKRSDGGEPPAPFGEITIRHLLESNSGLHQMSVRHAVSHAAGDRNGTTQPLTDTAIEHAVADRTMAGTPGQILKDGRRATVYGRTDYVVLGWIAARLAGVGSFDAALAKLVLEPLHMTRTRGARSSVEDRQTDEAIHHLPDHETIVSRVHDDRRIVPTTYGQFNYEVWGGAAGISSAVVDLARIGAALNCPVDSPLFSKAALDDLLRNAVFADTSGSDKGYHGFDTAEEAGATIALEKGGELPGVRAELWGRTGQRFIAIARNGNDVEGSRRHWSLRIDQLAEAVDWGTGDLFPQFGMPPLT